MKRNNLIKGIFAALGMLVLILDGQTALKGAAEGIDLCIRTIIPSLFPFFLLSITLTGILSGADLPLLKPLSRIFRTSQGTEAILITSLVGGYPVGAQCIAKAWEEGQIGQAQAHRMLSFCNNAGPSFIFGMVAMQFPGPAYGWLIWAIQLLSALAVARSLPAVEDTFSPRKRSAAASFTTSLPAAIRVMGTVCGWVVLFRVILAFGERWFLWFLPKEVQILLTGILELANGCCRINAISSTSLRFLFANLMLSFGGLCVFMQTNSILSGLSCGSYIKGKLMQTAYSLCFSLVVQGYLPEGIRISPAVQVGLFLILGCIFLRNEQKKGGVSHKYAV